MYACFAASSVQYCFPCFLVTNLIVDQQQYSWTTNRNSDEVIQLFEDRFHQTSEKRISLKLKPYSPQQYQGLLDDVNSCVEFSKWWSIPHLSKSSSLWLSYLFGKTLQFNEFWISFSQWPIRQVDRKMWENWWEIVKNNGFDSSHRKRIWSVNKSTNIYVKSRIEV